MSMLKQIVIVGLCALLHSTAVLAEGEGFPQPVLDAQNGVVSITVDAVGQKGERGSVSGTGFIVAPGWIVTNEHVVNPHLYNPKIKGSGDVTIFDGGVSESDKKKATVVATSPSRDLALLKVERLSKERPALTLLVGSLSKEERKTPLKQGYEVFALGFPDIGYTWNPGETAKEDFKKMEQNWITPTITGPAAVSKITTMPKGWGSAVDEQLGPVNIDYHGANINHGNSGGPLVSKCGYVVGVNTQGSAAENAFMASDVAELAFFLKDVEGVNYTTANTCDDGVVAAGHLVGNVPETSRQMPTWMMAAGGGLVLLALAGFAVLFVRNTRREKALPKPVAAVPAPLLPKPEAAFHLQGLADLKHLRFPLLKESVQIGSSSSLNDYAVPDQTVSRQHVNLRNRDGYWQVLTPHTTTNPTKLNGEVLPQHEARNLSHGDVLDLGDARFVFSETR